ncbi:DUF2252 family protein [Paenibacillus sp. GCM10023252]|uniref:DUF2252 family protein n=1 Tax=Paenibacillus sp. GCM10023252 TaxID=3252649 RepID=UPI00361CC59F
MNEKLTERVKLTQRKLRKGTLRAVFEEFDGKLMGLGEGKRAEKYRKMAAGPFSFYRGSAYLFYFDVTREWFPYHTPAERPTWIQGDLHFENFGAFRSARGALVYDVNDFDEGYLGSYLYDLLRMSVSIALVARMKELPVSSQQDVMEEYLHSYWRQMRRFARGKDDPASFQMDAEHAEGPVKKLLRKLQKRRDQHLLEKVTALVQEHRQFAETEEITTPSQAEQEALAEAWPQYLASVQADDAEELRHFGMKDIAVKHGSGTASIGLDRYYVLIEAGADDLGADDVVLEVKEVRVPVPAYFMKYDESFWQAFGHQGKRVVMTQQAMHHEADPYLGYLSIDGRDYYVRERSPYKKRLKLESLESTGDLHSVVSSMGKLTAKLHARADADVEKGILGYHSEHEIVQAMGDDAETFSRSIAGWALAYAEQVEQDYELFTEWLTGRLRSRGKTSARKAEPARMGSAKARRTSAAAEARGGTGREASAEVRASAKAGRQGTVEGGASAKAGRQGTADGGARASAGRQGTADGGASASAGRQGTADGSARTAPARLGTAEAEASAGAEAGAGAGIGPDGS